MSRPRVIRKLTHAYAAVEDRIALTALTTADETLLLWLTRRLANRLIAPLTAHLDEQVRASAGQAGSAPPELLHAFEQSAAEVQLRPQAPVRPEQAAVEGLLTEVDLAPRGDRLVLSLKWAGGRASLAFTPTELRQWLLILHKVYAAAGWTPGPWPDWLRGELADPNAAARALN